MSKRSYNFSLNNRAWDIEYSNGVPHRPFKLNNGWYFNFPQNSGHINFIRYQNNKPLSLNKNTNGLSLYMRVQMIVTPGSSFFYKFEEANTCDVPASTRICLIKNMYGNLNRWFSTQSIQLQNGIFELEVPLQPQYWSSVFGNRGDESKKNKRGF